MKINTKYIYSLLFSFLMSFGLTAQLDFDSGGGGGGGGGATVLLAQKESDETKTNDNTLVIDGDMQFELEANSSYSLEGIFHVQGDASGDFKFSFTAPVGTLGYLANPSLAGGSPNTLSGTYNVALFGAAAHRVAQVHTTITTTGTAGTFGLEWSQQTSFGTGTTLKEGSYILCHKLN